MTAPIVCPHCNAEVESSGAPVPFCCIGCKTAHGLLTAAGLDGFYRLRGDTRLSAIGARSNTPKERLWLAPLFDAAESKAGAATLIPLRIDVQGLECAACVWLLEKLFLRHPGAASIEVNPAIGRIELSYRKTATQPQEGRLAVEQFLDEAEQLGYRTGPAHKDSDAPMDDLVLRLGLCAAMAMNSMIFAFSQYFGLSKASDGTLYKLFSLGGFLLATATVLLGGTVFFRSAYLALSRRILHMDVPIALGILLTYVGSVWSYLLAEGRAAYFDTLCIFITLMLLGRLLQRRLASHNRQRLLADNTVDGLLIRTITETTSKEGTKQTKLSLLPAASVQRGSLLLCAPGELLPVSAQLVDSDGEFSLDWIMGESVPVHHQQGAVIPAGAHNRGQTAVKLRAEEAFSASQLRDLLCAPSRTQTLPGDEAAPADSTLGTEFWDFLSRYYVAAVLTLAALAFALWWHAGALRATEVAVAVLVVTCPCALGIATPLAYELAQVTLRRRGLFVRTPSFFDRALKVRHVLLDKTGTVTLSQLVLSSDHALTTLPSEATRALYQMVARSNHPVSRAILASLQRDAQDLEFSDSATVIEHAGQGLSLQSGDHLYRLGRPAFALCQDTSQDAQPVEAAQVILSCDGIALGQFSLTEQLCQDASAEVTALKEAGYLLHILSGDRRDKVDAIAAQLQISDAHAALTPTQKQALVQKLDHGTHSTLMIGDGINDALAFSAAACAGTPAIDRPTLPARADFYYSGVGIGPVSCALSTAHKLRAVILRNMALAGLYNSVVIGLSIAGLMTPLRCAVAMPISSLLMIAVTVASFRSQDTQRAATTSQPVHPSSTELALAQGVSS